MSQENENGVVFSGFGMPMNKVMQESSEVERDIGVDTEPVEESSTREDLTGVLGDDGEVILVDKNGEVVEDIVDDATIYIDENGNAVKAGDVKVPDGLITLTKGYMDYVKYVIFERAFVNIDGLKPSQRRILVTMEEIEKAKNLTKCATIVGSTLKLHPHGDASVYATLCRMIDSAGFWNVPIIKGKGSFQKTYTTAPSSASRYTECKLMDEASLYFDDIAGVNRVGNYDNSRTEPELLPVKYPAVLCNASSGIAVGIAANIPSFNFNEVLEATIEVIKTGTLAHPIAPDFSGGAFGGEYVRNNTELWKIMKKGKGTIQLRGKWTINKRFINITEIPYYTTEEAIKKVADAIPEVRACTSLSDINGMEIQIECMNQQVTEQVLQQLLKNSDLQMNVTACIMVIIDNKVPKQIGVIDVIKEWVKFRKRVLTKLFTQRIADLKYDIEKYGAFLTLILDKEFKQRFIDALSGTAEERAEDVLVELLPGLDRSIYTWILDRKIRTLASPISIQMKMEGYKRELEEVEGALADLDGYIIKELTELNKKYKYPRKTVVTDINMSINKRLIENYDVSVTVEDNFIKKYRGNTSLGMYHCKNEATLVMFDDKGRIIKIPLRDVPEITGKSAGVYIPTHLKIGEDFRVKYSTICSDKAVGYLHRDGWINTIDYSEWQGNKRNKRVIENGYASPETLYAVYNDNVPYSLILTNYERVGVFDSGYTKKSRTARTRYVKLKEGEEIVSYIPLTNEQYIALVQDEANLEVGKFKRIGKIKWNTDVFKKLDAESYIEYVIAKDAAREEKYRAYLETMKRVEETLRKEREARELKEQALAERNNAENGNDAEAKSGDMTGAVVEVTMGNDVLKAED